MAEGAGYLVWGKGLFEKATKSRCLRGLDIYFNRFRSGSNSGHWRSDTLGNTTRPLRAGHSSRTCWRRFSTLSNLRGPRPHRTDFSSTTSLRPKYCNRYKAS